MSETQVIPEIQADLDASTKVFANPYDFLASIPGAPSKSQIEAWKASTPNGRIRVFSPDRKRIFLVRGVSGLELANLQKQMPVGQDAAKAQAELTLHLSARAVVWTNITPSHTLTPEELRTGSAGLPDTLFHLISWISDFVDPDQLQILSAEL